MSEQAAQVREQGKAQQISSYHRVALLIAIVAGALGWLAYGFAMNQAPSVFGPKGAELYSKGQLGSVGGIIVGILIAPRIKDARIAFALAGVGLVLGIIMPWLYQIIPGEGANFILSSARDTMGPALFGFGTSALVRAADAKSDNQQ